MSDFQHALHQEAEAARVLLANLRDLIADDDELIHNTVEGETNLLEAIQNAVSRVKELQAFDAALDEQMKAMAARKARYEAQAERIRTAILAAMGVAEMKNLELAMATLSRKRVPPKAVIVNEAEIPSKFWKPSDPKLDRKAVLEALKAKEPVPGAELSNGSETVSIGWR